MRTIRPTFRQWQVYHYCIAYFRLNDALPTTYQIARHFEIRQTAAMQHVRTLCGWNYLERNEARGYRFIRPVVLTEPEFRITYRERIEEINRWHERQEARTKKRENPEEGLAPD